MIFKLFITSIFCIFYHFCSSYCNVIIVSIKPYILSNMLYSILLLYLPYFKSLQLLGVDGKDELNKIFRKMVFFMSIVFILFNAYPMLNIHIGIHGIIVFITKNLLILFHNVVFYIICELLQSLGLCHGISLVIAIDVMKNIFFSLFINKILHSCNVTYFAFMIFIVYILAIMYDKLSVQFDIIISRYCLPEYREMGTYMSHFFIKFNRFTVFAFHASKVSSSIFSMLTIYLFDYDISNGILFQLLSSFLFVVFNCIHSISSANISESYKSILNSGSILKSIRPGIDSINFMNKYLYIVSFISSIITLFIFNDIFSILFSLSTFTKNILALCSNICIFIFSISELSSYFEILYDKYEINFIDR